MGEYEFGTLRKLQITELEILQEIKRICENNNLRYFLIGGTLLGAVRHKGFIPWDDDLDVAMPREDYEKFIKICEISLDKKYFLHNILTDNKYWLPFSKIRKKDTIFEEQSISHLDVPKGIFVDIFPLDYSKGPQSKGQIIRTFFIKQISTEICYKAKIFLKHTFLSRMRAVLLSPFSIKRLTKIQVYLMKKVKSGKYYVNFGSNYDTKKQTIPIDYFEPNETLLFEGYKFSVPNNYKAILSRIYGEKWNELPPIEKRRTHMPLKIVFTEKNNNRGETNEEV